MTSEILRLTSSSARVACSSLMHSSALRIADRTSRRVRYIPFSVQTKPPCRVNFTCLYRFKKIISLRTIVSSCFNSNDWWYCFEDRIVPWIAAMVLQDQNLPFAKPEIMFNFNNLLETPSTIALRTYTAKNYIFPWQINCQYSDCSDIMRLVECLTGQKTKRSRGCRTSLERAGNAIIAMQIWQKQSTTVNVRWAFNPSEKRASHSPSYKCWHAKGKKLLDYFAN